MLELNKIYLGDCLQVMQDIAEKSIDAIITDPPYNIKKLDWDKWKTKESYIEWCSKWILECQRVLKDNGSFYFFHNDMPQIAMLMEWIRQNTKFIFKQFIVWNKKFDGSWNQLNAAASAEGLRNYSKQAEYILFYTFQDETGLEQILPQCFSPYLDYMTNEKEKIGWCVKDFNEFLQYKSIASHWFWQDKGRTKQPQPRFISQNDYKKLQTTGYFKREYEDLRREYEDLRREYEDLRREYEDLRYTFNNQKTHHSVWNYEIAKKEGHITQKPIDLIENIIKHSSNEGDTILDLFMGSGTTGVACKNLNRNFIGIEKEEKYVDIANKRIKDTLE